MRVLLVSKACIVGAYQTKLVALARRPDVELHVIVPPQWRGPEGVTQLERRHLAGYELIVSPIRFNGQFHLHYYPEFPHWVRRLRPDIVHFDEEPYNLATYLGLRASAAAGARRLFFTWQNLQRVYPWPFRAMERACFRLADYALAGSEDAAGVLRAKGYRGPLAVIPQFGVEPAALAGPRPERGDGALRVGYAGRLVPEKGVDVLLRALAGLTIPWGGVVLGNGPEEPRLRALAQELGLGGRVEFRRAIPSSEMPAFFGGIDVLVLPSLSRPNWVEQFGRVLIEAMAAGVAVVGSRCGEIPRVIGDAGLIFAQGDHVALGEQLTALAHDEELRRRLAGAGRERVLAHYTQESVAQRTYDVYRAMLGVCIKAQCVV